MKRYAMRTETSRAPPPRIAGVAISNPERPILEAPGHAKLDVVRYHEALAPWLLRELAPRPIAVVKCMDGRFDDCFFQKHPLRARDDDEESPPFMRLADIADVVRAVQNGAYEFHTWSASFPRLERPDRIILDLDPDTALPWTTMHEAAEHVRALLDRLELRWFVKTTGGQGLHFVVPITRRHSWIETREFARAIADTLTDAMPSLFAAKAGKESRVGRIYVDYLRNAEGATAVAAYSLRARPGLPVSMPIAWTDLAADVRGACFNIDNAATIVARRAVDPWADYERSRQTLSASMRRSVHA
ncbi:MAG TPA: non-homologous end-joining DNA ligase [Casimicrobiaceae bacterium]|nr:non-homologous end-joining DNA ligase [Casimicrobiaceae bacterium]HXU66982.1 non-homologous end-joining DNA ligase [Casimicrobiaceae bacterium]